MSSLCRLDRCWLWALSCFLCFEAAAAQDLQVAVPFLSESPRVDGEVFREEWSGAYVTTLSDSNQVLLARDAEHLYVALRLSRRGFGSLCVQKGDEVRILHASAALGTAAYTRDEDAWRLVEPFDFTMRETGNSDDVQRKRAAFLESHGWVASTVRMGEGEPVLEQEYAIQVDLFDPKKSLLGVVVVLLEPEPTLAQVPGTHDNGCADLELVQGFAPENTQFNPSGWLPLDLGREEHD